MPPAVRRATLVDATAGFAAQSDVVMAWAGTADLAALSAVAGWSVRDVLAHLSLSARRLADAVGDTTRDKPLEIAGYAEGLAAAAEAIATQPATLPGDPRPLLEAETARAIAVLSDAREVTVVMPRGPLRIADAVVTRTIELVVHGLDLGIEPDRGALGVTARALAGVFATRHPGRAVELRVAPFAAVQVLEGTVHRRGTPTAVVSCEPLAWVRLATGRSTWVETVNAGSLTARGERSDLSPYLPLLS